MGEGCVQTTAAATPFLLIAWLLQKHLQELLPLVTPHRGAEPSATLPVEP